MLFHVEFSRYRVSLKGHNPEKKVLLHILIRISVMTYAILLEWDGGRTLRMVEQTWVQSWAG
jgi:hypothetical protein